MADPVKLKDLFHIEYGNQLDKNKLVECQSGTNFVSRTSSNLGVDAKVEAIDGVEPYEAGLITATLGGTYLLSSFVQPDAFYTGQNIKVLRPLQPMSFNEKIYYCVAISRNRFRYTSHGREANKTFDDILVPPFAALPNWVNGVSIPSPNKEAVCDKVVPLKVGCWKDFRYEEIFQIKKGRRLIKAKMAVGETSFIGAIDSNNGHRQYVSASPNHEGGTITVNYNGSVAEAFYQSQPYWASDDVNVLYPKFEMSPFTALFLCTLIRQEKFRFNYGRKWHLGRMNESIIKLPVKPDGQPDWAFMESYVKALPFSVSV
jgi:Type I restriction modification DNA specificity domain